MRVLHLCSDYARQRLYGELISHLAETGIDQLMYVPVRSAAELGVGRLDGASNLQFRYSHVLQPYHRLLFRTKVRAVSADVERNVDVGSYSLIHAHFLYSDGAVALSLSRKWGLPYVVAVRNTDVNSFMRLRPDLRSIGWEVIRRASRVLFISPAYLHAMIERAPDVARRKLQRDAIVVPNGIGSFWLDDAAPVDRPAGRPLRLLFVGEFARNKNVVGLMEAIGIVNQSLPAQLTLVGGGGDGESAVDALLASGAWPFVTRTGRIVDRYLLRDLYRRHDIFVMPSFLETFGVAYIEAISQGLPVVHSRGQGVDGYFPAGTVSEAVDPRNPRSIADGTMALARRLPVVREECVKVAKSFAWPSVASTYQGIYQRAIEGPAEAA